MFRQLTGRPFGTPLALGTTAKALYQGRGRPHLFAGPAAAHRRPREWRIVVLRGLKDDDVVLSPADTDLEPGTDVAAGDPEPEAEPVTPVKKRRGRPRKTDAEREVAAVELEMAGGLGVGKVKKPRKRRKKGPEFSFVADGKVLSENCRGHLVSGGNFPPVSAGYCRFFPSRRTCCLIPVSCRNTRPSTSSLRCHSFGCTVLSACHTLKFPSGLHSLRSQVQPFALRIESTRKVITFDLPLLGALLNPGTK
ncbi:unnamed protein product [Phaeothamnion confervicola]